METPRLAMRLPAHVLNGLAVALGISLIQITLMLTAGKLAALAAATGAICASLADLPIAPARTWRRVGMGALVGCASGLLVGLLRESGMTMGLTIIVLAFCSTMALSWGLRAGPLSFIPILALIFTLAAPPPPDATALLIHSGWSGVGGLAYFCWAVLSSRVLQPRYRTLALAAALQALAALLRSRAALLSRSEGGTPPLQDWIRSQVALDERLQAARDLLFPAAGEPHTGPAIAVLLQAVEMRDTLLAGELDIELLGHDGPAGQLRERLRVHGMRVADAVDAMAQALRDFGMQATSTAVTPLDETDIENGEAVLPHPAHPAHASQAATAPAAAAAASIAASAASASATAPSAAIDEQLAAADAARVGAAAARAVEPGAPDVGPPADPASVARNAATAARAQTPARVPLFASTDPRYPLAVAFYGRARQMVAVLARMQAALRGEATPLPLARDELQVFISPEGWPLAALRAQLTTRSPIFRHAVRLSLALGSAYFIGLALPWASHPHWLVLSVAVVLRGNLEQTLSRRNDRVLGTMIGCLLVLVLAQFGAPWLSTLAFLLAVGIAHSFTVARYLVTAAAASVMALMQAHMAAPDAHSFGVAERIADTIMGAALAWGFSYVWPWWERRGIRRLTERVLKSLRALTSEVMRMPDPAKPDLKLRLARREVYEAVGAIASAAQRTSAEPESVRVPMYALAEMLTRCHVLMAQLVAVRLLLARRGSQLEVAVAEKALTEACVALHHALDNPTVGTSPQRGAPGAAGAPVVVSGTVPSEDVDHTAVPAALPDSAILPWLRRRLQLATRAARRVGLAAQALNAASR
ncbi:MAG: FUSC family protein [Burkholderiaceae bacterium]